MLCLSCVQDSDPASQDDGLDAMSPMDVVQ